MSATEGFAWRLSRLIGTGSQRAFARRCGMPESTLCNLLKGRREPIMATLQAIHDATGASLDWLVLGQGRAPESIRGEP